jgi:hypothetical protein
MGFEGSGDPDGAHCCEIALGSGSVVPSRRSAHGRPPRWVGVFDPANRRPGASELRARVDMLGLVAEHPGREQDDEIGRNIYLIPNPDRQDGSNLVHSFPVRAPKQLRNPLGLKG